MNQQQQSFTPQIEVSYTRHTTPFHSVEDQIFRDIIHHEIPLNNSPGVVLSPSLSLFLEQKTMKSPFLTIAFSDH